MSEQQTPTGAEHICPMCYHPFDACRHCEQQARHAVKLEAERWLEKVPCLSACREKRQMGITNARCMHCTMQALLDTLEHVKP